MANVDNSEDVIDSRDVIARIEELEAERGAIEEDHKVDEFQRADELAEWDDSPEGQELQALRALAEEASGSPDWTFGETLIRDTYFTEYAQELADDIGAIDSSLEGRWPYTCIDWERAARELKYDYTSVDFDGVTYWIRS